MRVLVALLLAVVTLPAVAAECVWQTPQAVEVGPVTLAVSQDALQKASEREVQGHVLIPDFDWLTLTIIDPRTRVWIAPLTRIKAGRCTAYYVGPATPEDGGPE